MTDLQIPKRVSSRHKKIGLAWLIAPTACLALVLVIYAILSFVLVSFSFSSDVSFTVARLIRVILGLLGILCVLAIIAGIPLGIIYLSKKDDIAEGIVFDPRSGLGSGSEVPSEIRGWNWGAAGLNWIWGVYYGAWISLLVFVPVVNIVMIFALGAKGNEWAWQAQKWESPQKFLESQNKWRIWGIIVFVLVMFRLAVFLLSLFSAGAILSSHGGALSY